MKQSVILMALVCLMLAACTPQITHIVPTNTHSLVPTATLSPTPTEWLPFDSSIYQDNSGTQTCNIPYSPTLPKEQADNLSRVQITSELFTRWLNHYATPNTQNYAAFWIITSKRLPIILIKVA